MTEITTPAGQASEPDRTYLLDLAQLEATKAKIGKLNTRTVTKGLSGGITLSWERVEVTETDERTGFEVTRVMYEVTFSGSAPAYEGWEFLATLDWDQHAGLMVQ